ncbi:MAG: SRPBCC family protein [Agriterribacter sp.]
MASLIELSTTINAPIEICFNLSRSVKLHTISTSHTNERVVGGRTEGLFELNDTVVWRAKHFAIYQQMEMKITAMDRPHSFEDCMLKGPFKSIRHKHYFRQNVDGTTVMQDHFGYEVPYGFAGILFNALVLRKYMTNLLELRNATIKEFAENGQWKDVLK